MEPSQTGCTLAAFHDLEHGRPFSHSKVTLYFSFRFFFCLDPREGTTQIANLLGYKYTTKKENVRRKSDPSSIFSVSRPKLRMERVGRGPEESIGMWQSSDQTSFPAATSSGNLNNLGHSSAVWKNQNVGAITGKLNNETCSSWYLSVNGENKR